MPHKFVDINSQHWQLEGVPFVGIPKQILVSQAIEKAQNDPPRLFRLGDTVYENDLVRTKSKKDGASAWINIHLKDFKEAQAEAAEELLLEALRPFENIPETAILIRFKVDNVGYFFWTIPE